MNWFPVLVFISLYSLGSEGFVVQKRSTAVDDNGQDSMFGSFLIGQMFGSDSFEASNSSKLITIMADYVYEICKQENELLVEKIKDLQDSTDLEGNFDTLAEASKLVESVITGSRLEKLLMKDPVFLEQRAKVSLENVGNSGNAMQTGRSPCNGPVPDIGKVNGLYGNPLALSLTEEMKIVKQNGKTYAKVNAITLAMLDYGFGGKPDNESRLGAYYATRGYKSGSVGKAIHGVTGAMYLFLDTVGEEKIGRIYNNEVVKALLNQPIESDAIRCVAAIEELYFINVRKENPGSAVGVLSSFVTPRARDCVTKLINGILCS